MIVTDVSLRCAKRRFDVLTKRLRAEERARLRRIRRLLKEFDDAK